MRAANLAVIIVASLALSACSTSGTELKVPEAMQGEAAPSLDAAVDIPPLVTDAGGFTVVSETFDPGAAIPNFHTFDGDNAPPPLAWSAVPEGTVELAIVMRNANRSDYVHWVATGLPSDSTGLIGGRLPAGAQMHKNDTGEPNYQGPDTPAGSTHTYVFSLYALAEPSGLGIEDSASAVSTALEQSATHIASMTGTHSG